MSKSKHIISSIFLFLICLLFISTIFSRVNAVSTDTLIYSTNRILQPVQGSWYYDERNCFIDFEKYLEGSTPNLTSGGTIGETDITGVYKYGSNLYTDMMPSTIPEIETLTNLTYNSTYFIENGFNNTGASWENITINSNSSINLNNTGHYQGLHTWYGQTYGADPTGTNLTVYEYSTCNMTVEHGYVGHNDIVSMLDNSGAGSCELEYGFGSTQQTTVEFSIMSSNILYNCIIFLKAGASIIFYLLLGGGYWHVYNDTGVDILQVGQANQWYNVKVDIDTTNDNSTITISNSTQTQSYQESNYGATSASLTSLNILTAWTSATYTLYLDSIDKLDELGYYDNRIYDLINMDGFYISDVIDFNVSSLVNDIDVGIDTETNSSLTVYVTDNSTGSFDNWMPYLDYLGNSTQFLKYKLLLNSSYAQSQSIFNNITFYLGDNSLIQPFVNEYDQILLFYPMKDASLDEAEFYYKFNLSDGLEYTHAEMEFVFLHAFYPYFIDNASTGHEFFTILLNDESQFKFALQSCYNDTSLEATGNWSVWMNDDYQFIDSVDYHYHQHETDSFKDFYFYTYDVVIEYWYNSKVSLKVSELTGIETAEYRFENTTDVFHNGTASSITQSDFYFGSNKTNGNAMMVGGISSSRMAIDYQRNQILDIITKNLTAYNIEEIITQPIQTINYLEMSSRTITSIEVKSELSEDNFISLIMQVGCNLGEETLTSDLDSYVTLDSTIWDNTIDRISFNLKYRCKNLNSFNNTITVKVTFIYVPHEPTVAELLILIIPPTLVLFTPPIAAFTKFKKMGFLVILFIMTLILMGINWIPLVPGLLMITLLVIIFLKILSQDKGDLNGN